MAIGNYTDQEIREWLKGKTPDQIAQQAASMGLNASQIQEALAIGGQNYSTADIQNYAANNGYTFGSNGGLMSRNIPQRGGTLSAADQMGGFYGYNGQQYSTARLDPNATSFQASNGQTYTKQQINDWYNAIDPTTGMKNRDTYGSDMKMMAQLGLQSPDLYKARYLGGTSDVSTGIYTPAAEMAPFGDYLKGQLAQGKGSTAMSFYEWRNKQDPNYLSSLAQSATGNLGYANGPEGGVPINYGYRPPASPPGMMASMGSSSGAGSALPGQMASSGSTGQSITIGGQTYTGDQIKSWLAGKSPDQVKAQAQAMGLTPQQVQQTLAVGGMNVSLPEVQKYMGVSSGASTAPAAPKTYAEYEALIKPEMLDAQGRFKGPQAGVNYMAEGKTPQEFYDFMNQQVGDPNARDGADAGQRARGPADPRWQEGVVSTKAGLLGNWGLPLAMIAAPFAANYLGLTGGTAGTAGTATGSATKAALYGDLGYTGMTSAELAALEGTAGLTAADKALLYSDVGYTGAVGADGLVPLTAETIVGSSVVPEVVAGTDTAGKLALLTAPGMPPLTMEALIGLTGLSAAEIIAAGGTAATGTVASSAIPNLLTGAVPGVTNAATGVTGATTATTAATTPAWWQQVAGPAMGLVGSVMNQNASRDAANTQADAQLRAAQVAADAAKFRPVGIKTNFGQSQFGYDANGNLNSAGYTLDPLLQGQLGRLAGASGGLMNQFTSSQLDTAPMRQAAMSAMTLGNQYLQTTPQQQAAKYMADQQGLLAPGRASDLAALQAQMQAQGRGGFAMGGGVNGQGAANPQMQALYNARMQQDAQLAADATRGGMEYTNFGLGTVGAGGNMLDSMYGTQSGSLNPYLSALGAAQKIEGLGQNALQMGMDLGGKVTNANAASGLLQAQGIQSAGNIVGANAQQNGNLWGNLLQGGGEALSRYKWGT